MINQSVSFRMHFLDKKLRHRQAIIAFESDSEEFNATITASQRVSDRMHALCKDHHWEMLSLIQLVCHEIECPAPSVAALADALPENDPMTMARQRRRNTTSVRTKVVAAVLAGMVLSCNVAELTGTDVVAKWDVSTVFPLSRMI